MKKINKTAEDLEKYIMAVIKKYQPVLLLTRNTFELESPTRDPDSYMECVFNYPYLNVTIKYSDKLLKAWQKGKDIVPYIIHEMCHVITDPLYSKATSRYVSKDEILDERELLTDYICNILVINKI